MSVELQAGAADVAEVDAAELEEIGSKDGLAEIAKVADLSSCSRSSGPVLRNGNFLALAASEWRWYLRHL